MQFSPRLVALAVIVLAGQAVGQFCPPDYELVAGECWRFATGLELNWEQSRTVCQDDGADLAIIKDCDVFATLVRHIHVNNLEPGLAFWIGGTDNGDVGDWSWVDDTPIEEMGVPFWGRGDLLENEPAGGELQNCAGLMAADRYYFHDHDCANPDYLAICELAFHQPGTPCPPQYTFFGTKCFLIDQEARGNWSTQRDHCQSLGGDLAVLDDCFLFGEAVDYIHINELEVLGSFWIGGTDLGNEGDWNWVNGEAMDMGVPYWGRDGDGPNQPGNDGGQQNCANLWVNDRLTFHDDDCTLSEGRSPLCHFVPFVPPETEDD